MSTPAAQKAEVLHEALPYIHKFRGSTFVVKYGGSFMDDPNPEGRERVATDIAFLQGGASYGRLRTAIINATMRVCGSRVGRGWLRPGGVRHGITDLQGARVQPHEAQRTVLLVGDLEQQTGQRTVRIRRQHHLAALAFGGHGRPIQR